jgi:hypothetical protein
LTNEEAIKISKGALYEMIVYDVLFSNEEEAFKRIIEMAEKYNEEHLRNVDWKILDGGGYNTKKATPNESGKGNQAKIILIDEIDLGGMNK